MKIERTNNKTYEYADYDSFLEAGWTRDMVNIHIECMEDLAKGINFIDRVKENYLVIVMLSAIPLFMINLVLYEAIFGSALEANEFENVFEYSHLNSGFIIFWLVSVLSYPFTFEGYRRLIIVYFLRPDLCRYFLFIVVTITSIISAPIINCIVNRKIYHKENFDNRNKKTEDV